MQLFLVAYSTLLPLNNTCLDKELIVVSIKILYFITEIKNNSHKTVDKKPGV